MSVFISPFSGRQILEFGEQDCVRYRIYAPMIYRSDTLNQTITVPAGFETQRRLPIVLLGHGVGSEIGRASLALHDYLCTEWYPVRIISWVRAADVLREALEVEGISKWRRDALYWAIRAAGERAFRDRPHA